MITDAFISGVPAGLEAYPSNWFEVSRLLYSDAKSQSPRVLIYRQIGARWLVSFVCYRFIGNDGRANSHFAISLVFDGKLTISLLDTWNLLSDCFSRVERSGVFFKCAPIENEIYKFANSSFTYAQDRIKEIIGELKKNALNIKGIELYKDPSKSLSNNSVLLSLDDYSGDVASALMRDDCFCIISPENISKEKLIKENIRKIDALEDKIKNLNNSTRVQAKFEIEDSIIKNELTDRAKRISIFAESGEKKDDLLSSLHAIQSEIEIIKSGIADVKFEVAGLKNKFNYYSSGSFLAKFKISESIFVTALAVIVLTLFFLFYFKNR